ncbi:hypothetical protein, partial [Maribacter dokdonensis]|uniref:hypothetical protein n=1 Tax=Maribacter dokdonensis TaxID=320912 RepID=UPI0032971703
LNGGKDFQLKNTNATTVFFVFTKPKTSSNEHLNNCFTFIYTHPIRIKTNFHYNISQNNRDMKNIMHA